ncbi:3-deoxy-D-manno-octulosonic acid transferase [Moheibacter sediminis]|uniref:3-deoxy-D-manno-octulosonic acid transferase n=1 Tax=Moheibacter sediminis TaxID=1434700 RepID=A0A1W2BQU7_9FLAO|nr:glycosyltransferase N-terminal domain-containing protein [Moheibacter sediminis]SMC74928.1 3-deoxy-D-manno-octulosonic-acid transferase [Moheibacter sediminis]
MNLIYNLFIWLYGLAVSIASSFNPKAKLWIDGRKNWKEKMKSQIKPGDKIIWVHCSSLGEFEQGRPVIEKAKTEFPNHKIAVSFFSPSGYEVRKNYKGADYIFYLPLDSKKNAKSLVKILHPEILILVKYEYWYNLLKRLQKKKIPIIVISAVIKEKNLFFKAWASWFRKIISKIAHFFVQDEDSKNLLESIHYHHVTVSGDTRFDRVKEILNSKNELMFVEKFKGNSKLIVAGSTWPDDDEILTDFINSKLPEDWKIIFAPHNIDLKKITQLKEKLKLPTTIYTQLNDDELINSRVLIVDTIGILTKIYSYADISYVGGGFTKTGVHNTLEPAVFGVPIIFGPNYGRYFEAVELIENEAAVKFENQFEFDERMKNLIENESERERRGKISNQYIQQKPNSTIVILDHLKGIISENH